MLFSTTTMSFYNRPIIEALEIIAHCGFDCAEIWVDHAWDKLRGSSSTKIKETLEKLSIESTIHCPIMDINITSNNQGIREESILQNFSAIDFAREVGSRLVVIHPGNRFSPRESQKEHWDKQIKALKRILSYAKEQGVIATIENMDSDKEVVSIKDHLDMIRLFQDAQIENGLITLDTTHLRTTEKVLNFIEAVGTQIVHLHLSDATLEQMHLALKTGHLDLEQIVNALRQVNYNGICSLECFIPNNDQELLKQELQKARLLWC